MFYNLHLLTRMSFHLEARHTAFTHKEVLFPGKIWRHLVIRISAHLLADIRQHPLKEFSEPYRVVFISWRDMGQVRRELLSCCQSFPGTVQQQQRHKSGLVVDPVSAEQTFWQGGQRWRLRFQLLSLNRTDFIGSSYQTRLHPGVQVCMLTNEWKQYLRTHLFIII